MRLLPQAVDLIKEFEGLKLEVYLDAAGLSTVGYGCRTDLPVGMKITQNYADRLLAEDLAKTEGGVKALIEVPVNDYQYSALVSFAYNLGVGTLKHSTLLKKLNEKDYNGAAEEFIKWVHVGDRLLPGLIKRRQAEKKLFNTTTQT